MTVEGSNPQQTPAPAAPTDMVAVYRHLIRMKRALDEQKRLNPVAADASPAEGAADDRGDAHVSG